MPFLDNIKVKSLYTTYSNKKALLRVRRYIFKYIQNLNKTINQIKYIEVYIKTKLQFYYNRINIIKYIYKYNSRTFTTLKVIKILEQLAYKNITKERVFIRVYIYY